MFTYSQSTGKMWRSDAGVDAVLLGSGYSGNGAGLNNPDAQGQHSVGPQCWTEMIC